MPVELLGQGTYGAVYRGVRAGEAVAVKVLSLQKETAEQVAREIELMRRCECEHIVAYKDAFHRALDGRLTLHLVMELAENGSTLDVSVGGLTKAQQALLDDLFVLELQCDDGVLGLPLELSALMSQKQVMPLLIKTGGTGPVDYVAIDLMY